MTARAVLTALAVAVAAVAHAQTPPVIAAGDDWTLPAGTTAAAGSGFFSEAASPSHQVATRVVDVTWRQLNPSPGVYSTTATGAAQGMAFPSLADQLADPGPFWMRVWASGVDWAPAWVPAACGLTQSWTDYDGQDHLPIWDSCLWGHLMDLYEHLFITMGLRADDRLRLVYVPGAFTWCEFDFDIVDQAAADGLSFATFDAWFQPAMADLVTIFNGNNADPADDQAHKLVYTGEDYPFGPWGSLDDGFALAAVNAGLGIRTGITELFNFHLNHVPAWGATIAADGHVATDDGWQLFDGRRVAATENECYTSCGFTTADPYYAVKMSNLKALQLRVNWLYVVPTDSYMDSYPEHWEWVRLSLGRTAATSPDAWVALREAEDRYWLDDDSHTWSGDPWVRNLERWISQVDQAPDGVTRRGSDLRSGVLDPDNGTAYEGRRTEAASGQTAVYFIVADAFLAGPAGAIELKLTYLDSGATSWHLEYPTATGVASSATVQNAASGLVKTATFAIADAVFSGQLAGGADFRVVRDGGLDLELRFVRLVKLAPSSIFADGFEGGSTAAWTASVE